MNKQSFLVKSILVMFKKENFLMCLFLRNCHFSMQHSSRETCAEKQLVKFSVYFDPRIFFMRNLTD